MLLQLILCFSVGFSTLCLGMDDQDNKIVGTILHVSKSHANPHFEIKDLILGKLQLYYKVRNDNNEQDTCFAASAARFIPNEAGSVIEFSNADYGQVADFLRTNSNFQDLATCPLYMRCKIKNQYPLDIRVLEVKDCEKFNEPEELLDIPKFNVCVEGDNISLYNDEKRIVLRDQKNIRQIRQALSRDTQFKIEFFHQINGNGIGKVTSYENGAYVWWDGWNPSFKSLCVGMTFDLGMGDPFTIPIDLNKEKEEIHHYSRNKFMRVVLGVAILGALCYNKSNW